MVMYFKRLSLAGIAVVMSTAAFAADLPAPVIEHIPQVPAVGGWYLRGDIGYKLYGDPDGSFNDPVVGNLRYQRESMDNAWMIGVGVGYMCRFSVSAFDQHHQNSSAVHTNKNLSGISRDPNPDEDFHLQTALRKPSGRKKRCE